MTKLAKFPVIPARILEIPGNSRREFWGSAIPGNSREFPNGNSRWPWLLETTLTQAEIN